MIKTSPPTGPPNKKARTTKHPFGNHFYARIAKLLMGSKDEAVEGLNKCCEEIADYKKEHPGENLCDSGDEMGGDPVIRSSIPTKKLYAGVSQERLRLKQLETVPDRQLKKTQMSRSAGSLPDPKEESSRSAENSEDSDDGMISSNEKKCLSCSISKSSSFDQLLQCHTCKEYMHMKCNKPEISKEQARDPRFHFICSECINNEVEKRPSLENSKGESPKVQKTNSMSAVRPTVDFNQKLAEFKAKKNLLGNNKSATMLLKK